MLPCSSLAPALLLAALAGEPATAEPGLAGRWVFRDDPVLLVEFRAAPDGSFTGTVVRGHPEKRDVGHALFRDLRKDGEGGWVGRLSPPDKDVRLSVRVSGDALVAVASKLFVRKELHFVRALATPGGSL
jgi:hypothetical protein